MGIAVLKNVDSHGIKGFLQQDPCNVCRPQAAEAVLEESEEEEQEQEKQQEQEQQDQEDDFPESPVLVNAKGRRGHESVSTLQRSELLAQLPHQELKSGTSAASAEPLCR